MSAESPDITAEQFSFRFRILRELGRGGYADVHEAVQLGLDRRVAIKKLGMLVEADTESRRRFDREARLLASVQHPSLVRLFDFGIVERQPFLVLELVEGTDLAALIYDCARPRDTTRLLSAACDALSALSALHEQGILHRDVKPANILVPHIGSAKLADLGLALMPGHTRVTAAHGVLGTPGYVAPELLLGAETSKASDLYSAGVLLWEVLTGELPRGRGCTPEQFHMRRTSLDAMPLAMAARGLPPRLTRLVDELLRRKPERRPASAAAVHAELSAILGRSGSSTVPRPRAAPAARRRETTRRVLRHAGAAMLIGAAIALLAVGLAVELPGGASTVGPAVPSPAPGPASASTADAPPASPSVKLRTQLNQLCEALTPDRVASAALAVRRSQQPPAARVAQLQAFLARMGYERIFASLRAERRALLHTSEGSKHASQRVGWLSRLGLLRRLDRLAQLERLDFDSGVDALLAPDFALEQPPRLGGSEVTVAIPVPAAPLYQSGMHLRRAYSADKGFGQPADVTIPEPYRFRRAWLSMEVDELAASSVVQVKVSPSGLLLELHPPAHRTSAGSTMLAHAFDPHLLAPGVNGFALALDTLTPGFRPDRIFGLALESLEELRHEGLACTVLTARLILE